MIIQTLSAKFLIESSSDCDGCLMVYSDNSEQLQRLFGSSVHHSLNFSEMPFLTKTCKQDFAHTLILLVKEIDYSNFPSISGNLPVISHLS